MSQAPTVSDAERPRGRRWIVWVPLLAFGALAAMFFVQLFAGPPSRLPSALIGRDIPRFTLPAIEGSQLPGLAAEDFQRGRVTVVNVWASWCVPCRDEHPYLVRLAEDRSFDLVGINNKDRADNARRFLAELGNPFTRVGADLNGRVSIDWGVYGVPETFVVDGAGRIAFKHVGPIDAAILRERIIPAIRRAQAGS